MASTVGDGVATPESGEDVSLLGMYSGPSARWPGNVVYYEFDASLSQTIRDAAQKAVNHYNSLSATTGLSLVRGTNNNRYVRILPTTGVAHVSDIGYTGREQYMWLNSGIWQVAVHEFGHVLGLWHEHQRCERDGRVNAPNSGETIKHCELPTAEAYNLLSVMHYSAAELAGVGASFRPGFDAPAKSLHPGLVDSDLRSIATLYGSDGVFSEVSLMHGKCLDAPSAENGTRVHMWDCINGNPNQRWTYSAATGELKVHGNKCLDGWGARRLDPVVVHECHGGGNQKWDIGSYGEIVLRGIKDEIGRPLCADIGYFNRDNGAQLLLQYCHRGDNQFWRRSPGSGGSTVTVVSDIIPANVTDQPRPSKCIDALNGQTGTQLHLWDCQGPNHANQRFMRTVDKELRIHGKCVDGHAGQVGDPVKVWDCHGGVNQKWDLTPSGELKGVNGLCINVTGANNANGTPAVLRTCTGNSAEQRWSYRDPR